MKNKIFITDKIDFKMMLPGHTFKNTEAVNSGLRLLEQRTHNFLIKRFSYKIEDGYITIYGIESTDIDFVIRIVNH